MLATFSFLIVQTEEADVEGGKGERGEEGHTVCRRPSQGTASLIWQSIHKDACRLCGRFALFVSCVLEQRRQLTDPPFAVYSRRGTSLPSLGHQSRTPLAPRERPDGKPDPACTCLLVSQSAMRRQPILVLKLFVARVDDRKGRFQRSCSCRSAVTARCSP